MPNETSKRKAATELEVKLSAGDSSAVGALVDLLDEPMHSHLIMEFPALLSLEDREDLIMGFLADLVKDPTIYQYEKASLTHFAKICIKRKAIDLLRRRNTAKQFELVSGIAGVLSYAGETSPLDIEFRLDVERVKVEIADLDPKYQAALHAYVRHGRADYKAALVREYGIKPDAAATWLSRAFKTLRAAIEG